MVVDEASLVRAGLAEQSNGRYASQTKWIQERVLRHNLEAVWREMLCVGGRVSGPGSKGGVNREDVPKNRAEGEPKP